MARIAGVDLPREKRVEIGLTYIYGIGLTSAQKILAEAKVNPDIRVKDLTDDQVQAIRKAMDGGTWIKFYCFFIFPKHIFATNFTNL